MKEGNVFIFSPSWTAQPDQYLRTDPRRQHSSQHSLGDPGRVWHVQKSSLILYFFFPHHMSLPPWESQTSLLLIRLYRLPMFPPFNQLIPALGILLSALVNHLSFLPPKPDLNSSSREPSLINRIPAYLPYDSKSDLGSVRSASSTGVGLG